MSVDLATFKPDNADDLLEALLGAATGAAGASWSKMRDTVEDQLAFIAKSTLDTATRLADMRSRASRRTTACICSKSISTQRCC